MKASTNPPRIQFEEPASSFSWTEKLVVCRSSANGAWRRRQPDEHNQSGILTWGVKPASRLPGPSGPVAVGVSSPTQWRNRPRFSRGSLAFGCVARRTHAHLFQRTGFIMWRSGLGAKQILAPILGPCPPADARRNSSNRQQLPGRAALLRRPSSGALQNCADRQPSQSLRTVPVSFLRCLRCLLLGFSKKGRLREPHRSERRKRRALGRSAGSERGRATVCPANVRWSA